MTIHEIVADEGVSMARQGPRDGLNDFEEFVHATGDRIYRSALLLCGNHHLAQDLTQTTYTKVYAAWSRVSTADSPMAYTRTVLMRTFLSLRRQRRVAEYPVAELSRDDGQRPGCRVPTRAARGRPLSLAAGPDRAGVALLGGPLGRRHRRALGIRPSTCRTRTTRALARLRTLMPDLTLPNHDTEEHS